MYFYIKQHENNNKNQSKIKRERERENALMRCAPKLSISHHHCAQALETKTPWRLYTGGIGSNRYHRVLIAAPYRFCRLVPRCFLVQRCTISIPYETRSAVVIRDLDVCILMLEFELERNEIIFC